MITIPISPKISQQLDLWDKNSATQLEIDSALVKDEDFSGITKLYADGSRFEAVILTTVSLDKCELTDVTCAKLEAAGLSAYKANLLRVAMTDCRLTGAEFGEAQFKDCTFRNIKFDQAGFRFAHFKRVRFEDCLLRQTDFSSAKLEQVMFTGCDFEAASFISASCKDVDVTTEDITTVKGILGLKGATISELQLMQIAPLLATELGFQVAGQQ